jgi:hypothetical protein
VRSSVGAHYETPWKSHLHLGEMYYKLQFDGVEFVSARRRSPSVIERILKLRRLTVLVYACVFASL